MLNAPQTAIYSVRAEIVSSIRFLVSSRWSLHSLKLTKCSKKVETHPSTTSPGGKYRCQNVLLLLSNYSVLNVGSCSFSYFSKSKLIFIIFLFTLKYFPCEPECVDACVHIPTYMPTGVKVGVRYHPCSLFHCIHWCRVSQSKPELSELSHLLASSFWGFLSVTWGWNYRFPQCSPEFLLGSRDQSSSFDPHTLTLNTLRTVSWAPIFLCKLIFIQVIVLYHRNFNNKP